MTPVAAPLYGDLVGRWLAAKQGRSFKCLVMDLDNTLWGGVIGDDGLEGIALGQGSPLGEAYTAFQDYARELSRRGVILAVCSKNDEANALEPFEKHPDMVLRRGDIASFVANWSNKADNIRAIAAGAEHRAGCLVLHRRQPVRAQPGAPGTADGGGAGGVGRPDRVSASRWPTRGYFEGLAVTEEDRERTSQYQGNKAREALKAAVTDLPSYLRGLEMQLIWKRIRQDRPAANRAAHQQVEPVQPDHPPLYRGGRHCGDGGPRRVRAATAADSTGSATTASSPSSSGGCCRTTICMIDTWLMSCRVLGRQVEPTTLNLIAPRGARSWARDG